ncbi:MAG: hypothetical protein LDLANPLL_00242 [Turneriella sp.]|nr:hypothetical protein [Turneriella sp.]
MRYLAQVVAEDLETKMVLVAGPRQVGKTTFVRAIGKRFRNSLYLNYDNTTDRKKILNQAWSDANKLLVFDEIHKYSRWKNFLKGICDTESDRRRFLVTGSARLDIYRRGQDSMFGRYFLWRMHPFCLAELAALKLANGSAQVLLQRLLTHSGFPEPFLKNSNAFTRRWRALRAELVFRQDIREIEQIKDITLLEQLHDLLRNRVGGMVAMANLARDLEIAPKTAKAWLEVLERSYALFSVKPYAGKLARAILKPPKIYFFDNGEVEGGVGQKFENLVATHLIKRLDYLSDFSGHRFELSYVRDKEGREVDFVVIKDKKPIALIEAKYCDAAPHAALVYFGKKLGIQNCIQLVAENAKKKTYPYCTIWPAAEWLSQSLDKDIF